MAATETHRARRVPVPNTLNSDRPSHLSSSTKSTVGFAGMVAKIRPKRANPTQSTNQKAEANSQCNAARYRSGKLVRALSRGMRREASNHRAASVQKAAKSAASARRRKHAALEEALCDYSWEGGVICERRQASWRIDTTRSLFLHHSRQHQLRKSNLVPLDRRAEVDPPSLSSRKF